MTTTPNIEKIISELLYNNDCVIVPGFGGFVTVYKPATILPKQHVMLPPSREIGFNKKLVNNDGLLANEIAMKKGLTFDQTLQIIQERVAFYQSELTKVKRLEITNIGVLYVDKDDNYRFMPDESKNFLKKSFGLNKIYLDKVAAKKEEIASHETTHETKVIPIKKEEKKPVAWRKIAGVAAMALFLLGGYWLGSKMDESNTSLAMLNPFSEHKKNTITTNYQKDKNRVDWKNNTDKEEISLDEVINNTNNPTVKYSFIDGINDGLIIRTDKDKITPTSSEKNENTSEKVEVIKSATNTVNTASATTKNDAESPYNYYIVAGAFQERINADKLVNKLKKKGFNAHIFAKKNKLNYVCFDGYASKSEAKAALSSAKMITPSAWIKAK